jgi:ClpP class serine protease
MTEENLAWQYKRLKNYYDCFVNHVTEGRDMTYEDVDSVGRGRIWTGKSALGLGLVDTLGTLTDAIQYAAKCAGVPVRYTTTHPYPSRGYSMKPISLADRLFQKSLEKHPVFQKAGERIEQELLWKENDIMIILPWIKTDMHFSSGGETWHMLE